VTDGEIWRTREVVTRQGDAEANGDLCAAIRSRKPLLVSSLSVKLAMPGVGEAWLGAGAAQKSL
jgi:hypothetical protein